MSEQLSEREIRQIIRDAMTESAQAMEARNQLQGLQMRHDLTKAIRSEIQDVIGIDSKQHMLHHASFSEVSKQIKDIKLYITKRIVFSALCIFFAMVIVVSYPNISKMVPGLPKQDQSQKVEVQHNESNS